MKSIVLILLTVALLPSCKSRPSAAALESTGSPVPVSDTVVKSLHDRFAAATDLSKTNAPDSEMKWACQIFQAEAGGSKSWLKGAGERRIKLERVYANENRRAFSEATWVVSNFNQGNYKKDTSMLFWAYPSFGLIGFDDPSKKYEYPPTDIKEALEAAYVVKHVRLEPSGKLLMETSGYFAKEGETLKSALEVKLGRPPMKPQAGRHGTARSAPFSYYECEKSMW